MNTVIAYFTYIAISIATTIWVGRTLHKNGRIFLVESFKNEEMADSVNHLLVVGFYLLNFGFVSLFLKFGEKPNDLIEAIEYISTKEGVVLLVLGALHFFNMFNISKMRKKAQAKANAAPQTFSPAQ